MEPNWNEYRAEFPDRYWKHGVFDDTLDAFLQQRTLDKCVDIGGGVLGTQVLKHRPFSTFLLDPHVTQPPPWMAGRVDWGDPCLFDLAVARGSINYFSDPQFFQLRDMISPDGCLIANTFLHPPSIQWRERTVRNGNGEIGREIVRLNHGLVEHILEFAARTIEHSFFYRSEEDFQRLLPGCVFIQHAPNSYTLFWQKT